jgi:predicted permease
MKEETFKYIGEKPWEYLPVVNECIKILLTIGVGIVTGYFEIFEVSKFVPQATRFVFYVALPLHVLTGVGVGVDFYDDTFLWKFIFAFLILRVVALVFCIIVVLIRRRKPTTCEQDTTGIGETAVLWLTLTWISTIILGVPISTAVFGDPSKGRTYGILAAISSFILQLPLQLFFLECHVMVRDILAAGRSQETSTSDEEANRKELDDAVPPEESAPQQATSMQVQTETVIWLELARRGDIWKKIIIQVLRNPVLWGIGGGFVLSLSTVGPRFLNPTSPDFVPGFQWFVSTTGWLGACVSPVSLFAMGVWMQSQGIGIVFGRTSFYSALISMISKLVIVPLFMIGLAKAFDFNDEAGRAAVLIASLPISMASFSLASRYKIGEEILSQNVALGTALVLPTVLVWNIVMDSIDLFPLDK